MNSKKINKAILSLGMVAPILATSLVVSCGSTDDDNANTIKPKQTPTPIVAKKQYMDETRMAPLAHDWSFLAEPQWVANRNAFKQTIGVPNVPKDITEAQYMSEAYYAADNFGIQNILNVKTKQGYFFHERLTKTSHKNLPLVAEAYGGIYNFGTKSDILTPQQGIPYFKNIKDMVGADQYDYLSNITPHTLSEGGHLNLDLLIKDGVVYNVPKINAGGNKKATFESKRAGIIMSKDGTPTPVANIPVDDPTFMKLKVISGEKSWEAKEKKNVAAFDDELKDKVITATNQDVIHLPTTISNMTAGETRVINEFYTSQKETLNLTGLKAYEVSATEVNNISTTKNILGQNMIMQSPYVAHVVKDVSGQTGYKSPLGASLIVHKDSPTDAMNLKVGDAVDTKYELQDSHPVAHKLIGAKWAVSTIDYGGARYWYDHANINKFDGDEAGDGSIMTNGSWILRNNEIRYLTDTNWAASLFVPKGFFVIDRVHKTFGTVHFHMNKYAKSLTQNSYVLYLKSLGFTDIISLDGGGSSYAYKRVGENFESFPRSVDGAGYRVLSTALAIGDIYE